MVNLITGKNVKCKSKILLDKVNVFIRQLITDEMTVE